MNEADHTQHEEPILVKPEGLVGVILLLMTVTATAAVVAPSTVESDTGANLRLTNWIPDPTILADMTTKRARRVAHDLPTDPAAKQTSDRIVNLMRGYLDDEKRMGFSGVRANPTARVKLNELEELIRGFSLQHGNAAFAALATAESKKAGELAEKALVAATAARKVLGTPGAAELAEVKALEVAMPGVTKALARVGVQRFVRGGRLEPSTRLVIEALMERRWLVFTHRLPPPPIQRDSDVERLLLAFRIEAQDSLSTQRKLELVDEMTEINAAYPTFYVTAVLLAREGKFRAARALFLRAAKAGQFREQARINATWCRRRLKSQSADG